MKNLDQLQSIARYPNIKFIIQHGRLGLSIVLFSILTGTALVVLNSTMHERLPEYIWGALMSIPITLLCMGFFSVLYEWSIRNTFIDAMRSLNAAWNTGVTVYPTHKSAPNRGEVLRKANKEVRLMSTTLIRYFIAAGVEVNKKIESGIKFYFILYDPDSNALNEKADEENAKVEDFRDEIRSTCRRFLAPLKKDYPDRINIKFCKFNTPFGITIIDNVNMVLSLNIYGLSRSKDETPCLIIENKYDKDSVFKLYEASFNAIWDNLDNEIPLSLRSLFSEEENNE